MRIHDPIRFPLPSLLWRLLLAICALGACSASAGTSPSSAHGPLVQYGDVEFRPHLSFSGSYNDGLLVRPGISRNSYIDAFSPGLLLRLGQRWSVDYTPTWTYYSNPAFRDTLGHAVNAAGGLAYREWALAFTQTYNYSSNPLLETGRQTDTEVATTELTAIHGMGPVLAVEGGFAQRLNFVSGLPDFHEWGLYGALQAKLSERTTVRGIVDGGYAAVYKSPDMVYVLPGGEIAWTPTSRLTLSGKVGLDYRVVLSRRWRWMENPVFAGSVRYEPFSTSKVEGKVERTIAPSMFDGQTSNATRWSVSGEQRFLGHFWVSGGLNYDDIRYLTTGRSIGFERKDHTWSYNVAIRTTFRTRGGISVSYQDSDNDSNREGYAVKSSRIACDVSWKY